MLPRASCKRHADLTSNLERQVVRDTYGVHRAHEGSPSRRKGRHESILNAMIEVAGIDKYGNPAKAHVRIGELPRLPMVVKLKPPKIFSPETVNDDPGITLECLNNDDPAFQKLMSKLEWREIQVYSSPISSLSFLRVLAKIGHTFACAEMGNTPFTPTLLPLILDGDMSAAKYVGGYSPEKMQSDKPLSLRREEYLDQLFLVVDISLHFFPNLPRYQVVCGTLN